MVFDWSKKRCLTPSEQGQNAKKFIERQRLENKKFITSAISCVYREK